MSNLPLNGHTAEGSRRHLVVLREVVKGLSQRGGRFHRPQWHRPRGRVGCLCVHRRQVRQAGKSTLINVLTGIDRPTSGEVLFNRTPVHTMSEEQIAGLAAAVRSASSSSSSSFLPTLTAVENILLAMDYGERVRLSERPARAMALLERVGLADKAHRLPSALSGGEQQCVAIARSLANDPVLLTADEPTGNLDSNRPSSFPPLRTPGGSRQDHPDGHAR